ncbi:MAG: TIGR02710 family CRISPR-associated protein [Gammaproteobacteria bacterium]|nr:TIGR02710 family CRISPR-associated protein [Gammaproteobacteria bacterium]
MKEIVVFTVGGSHQPIVTAIKNLQPDYVCFICSEDDVATGSKGSWIQIEQKGLIIKKSFSDDKPTLPNIPTQCDLTRDQYDVVRIEADQLVAAVSSIKQRLRELIESYPLANLTADYTGGTKTMSAGLVLSTLDFPQVGLHVVTGPRSNLVKVDDKSELGTMVSIDSLRFSQQLGNSVGAWQGFGYDLAAESLDQLRVPQDRQQHGTHCRLRDLSRAFAAWDRFDHKEAYDLLQRYQTKVGPVIGYTLTFLKMLNSDDKRQAPAQWLDLWLNAKRRAKQQRYDDAVARCYRLWEWAAQWILESRHQLKTADLPHELQLPFDLPVNRDGKRQASLLQSWRLIAAMDNDSVANFMREQEERLRDLSQSRNGSILAHGYASVSIEQWEVIEAWTGNELVPVMCGEFAKNGVKLDLERLQLPSSAKAFM